MDILKGLHKEFGWFIWGLVGLGFIWFFTGGPQREVSHQGVFLKPPAPLDTGEAYGKYYAGKATNPKQTVNLPDSPDIILETAENTVQDFLSLSEQAKKIHSTSLLSKNVFFDGNAGARNTQVNEEYLRIVASQFSKDTVQISGLLLKGHAFGTNVVIPTAANLPLTGVAATKSDVFIPANGRVLISSGRSPIGTSFRVNMCTGYLDQFQQYTPALFKECPKPQDELKQFGPSNEASCVAFVEKLPRCRVYRGTFPSDISTACKTFVTEKLNYNACALNHKNDKTFYQNEWRLFLDKGSELWKDRNEVIRLVDSKGKVIDAITY